MTKLSRDARDLLCAARAGHAPPREARERVRARVIARVGAGVAVGSATALGTSSTAAKTALSVGLFVKCAAVVGVAGVVALVAVERRPFTHGAPPVAAPAASVAAAPSPELADPPEKPIAPPMQSASASPVDAPPAVTATPSAVRSRSLPAASPPGSSLEAETALLNKALAELHAGHPERALAAFDDAAQKGGVLHEEQRAGRIFALCAAGRTSEAKAEAARFLAESPRSPLAERVRSSCAGRQAP